MVFDLIDLGGFSVSCCVMMRGVVLGCWCVFGLVGLLV